MSDQNKNSQTGRSWLTGLAVIVAVIVSYVGFASVSVEWTLAVSTVIFIGLVIFLWRAGARKQGGRGHRR